MNDVVVEPCPPHCAFDWGDFHEKLDGALAHMIEESGATPSETTLLEFLHFSNAKRKAQEAR